MGIRDELDTASEESARARGLARIAQQQRTSRDKDALIRALTKEVEQLERDVAVLASDARAKPLRIKKPKSNRKSPVMPWMLWSDHHIEERVSKQETGGKNEYDLDISKQRFESLVQHSVELIQHEAKRTSIADVGLWLGGDFMTGHIHDDLVEVTQVSPLEAAEEAGERLYAGISYILDKLAPERLIVPTSWGNHGRTHRGRPRIATMHSHNLEQAVYLRLAKRFASEGCNVVEFDTTPSAFKYVTVGTSAGPFVIRFNHGDKFGYQGGLAGLTAPFRRSVGDWDTDIRADLTCLGHWHTKQDFGWGLINGALIGMSEYSRKFAFEPPSQTLFFVDLERGRKAGVYPIWLD